MDPKVIFLKISEHLGLLDFGTGKESITWQVCWMPVLGLIYASSVRDLKLGYVVSHV